MSAPALPTPPPMPTPISLLPSQLSRLSADSLQLAHQFHSLVDSVQSAHTDLSQLTLEYMRSLDATVQSSSAAVDILIDTHTSLIRKMLIAIQQTASIDELERGINQTKLSLTEMERGIEMLLAEDAIQATRQQLQQELDPRSQQTPIGRMTYDPPQQPLERTKSEMEAEAVEVEQHGGTPMGPLHQTTNIKPATTTAKTIKQTAAVPPPIPEEPLLPPPVFDQTNFSTAASATNLILKLPDGAPLTLEPL